MKFRIVLLVMTVCFGGCSTYMAPPYSVSIPNVHKIKTNIGDKNTKIRVNEFTKTPEIPDQIMCRGAGPVTPSSGKSYEKYIRDAMTDEFILAGIYDDEGEIALDGQVDELNFDSMAGTWKTKLTVTSSNGKSLIISDESTYGTSFDAISACHNVANAFPFAIQSLLTRVISNKNFLGLLFYGPSSAQANP